MVSYIVIFVCLWWVLFFIMLPIGNSYNKKVKKGTASSAPEKSHIKLKMLIATILSLSCGYFLKEYIDSLLFTLY